MDVRTPSDGFRFDHAVPPTLVWKDGTMAVNDAETDTEHNRTEQWCRELSDITWHRFAPVEGVSHNEAEAPRSRECFSILM